MAIVANIPARFGSTRPPGKPLSDIHGRTLNERAHERVFLAPPPDRVRVATGAAVAAVGSEPTGALSTGREHRCAVSGLRIRAVWVEPEGGVAVDSPEDLERVRAPRAAKKGRVA